MDKSYGSVVFQVIDNQVQFLLIQHAPTSFWDIPKGHPEGEEKPEEAAIREVMEETNYQIELISGFAEMIQYILPRGEQKQVVFFLGKAIQEGTQIINPDEISSVKWFSFEDALAKITFDNSRSVLKSAFDFMKKSVII